MLLTQVIQRISDSWDSKAPQTPPPPPPLRLSPNAPWLPKILCALGRSLALSEPRFLESMLSPTTHLLSACCVLGSEDSAGSRCYCF